ncbi:MAG: MFS transporter [Planctomycetota bacterium]|nr:MFS transporter [Planctomycetota bacterium]
MTPLDTPASAPRMGFGLGSRLSFMMFLQYAIWGAWLPFLYVFLANDQKFTGWEIGWMFTAGGIGAIFGPFLAGQVADRWFNTERYLGLSHLAGAVVVFFMSTVDNTPSPVEGEVGTGFWFFLSLSILYSLIYSPTIALTNSLSFHHMPDRDRDFGRVRLWGTLGWIAVGIGVGQLLYWAFTPADATPSEQATAQAAGMVNAFRISAILGIVMGLYCFTLPRTPPQPGKEKFAFAETLKEVRSSPLVILFLIAVPISMIHQFYFIYTGPFLQEYQNAGEGLTKAINSVFGVGGGGLMTIGQLMEILVLFLIPFVASKWSRKTLLIIGVAAYAARMFLFSQVDWLSSAIGIPDMVTLITGVSLHGLCFGCFIFVAFMIVDEECSGDVKATAQNLFNLVIVGVGIVVGSLFSTMLVGEWATNIVPDPEGATADATKAVMDWTRLFAVPMYMAIGCLLLMLAFYPGKRDLIGRRSSTMAG